MNKILKTSFWSTVIIYFGVVIGFLNSIILFPKYLSTEQIGVIRQLISASYILTCNTRCMRHMLILPFI